MNRRQTHSRTPAGVETSESAEGGTIHIPKQLPTQRRRNSRIRHNSDRRVNRSTKIVRSHPSFAPQTGRTSGALLLSEGDVKEKPSCASDGYCKAEERCCPSKCAQRHICLKSLPEEEDEEE